MLLRLTLSSSLIHIRDFVVRAIAWKILIRDGFHLRAVPVPLDFLRGAGIAGLGVGRRDEERGCYSQTSEE